jgi:HSP20 family protein
MAIVRYDPFSQINSLLRWPSLFDEDFQNASQSLDIYETDTQVVVKANVAGIDQKKVKVTFHKGVLTITGEEEDENKTKRYYQKSSQSYYYKVAVPGEINPNKEPSATFKNGIVEISFEKIPEEKPKEITIKEM